MAATRRMRTAAFVAFWALAGLVVVMHGALQYTNPAAGRSIKALPSRAMSQTGARQYRAWASKYQCLKPAQAGVMRKQEASRQTSESRTGPGLHAVAGVATAVAMCFGIAVGPAAARDVHLYASEGKTAQDTARYLSNLFMMQKVETALDRRDEAEALAKERQLKGAKSQASMTQQIPNQQPGKSETTSEKAT